MEVNFLEQEIFNNKEIKLTEREIEVIKFYAFGLTYKEIAKKLHLAPCTIIKHKKNVLKKTGLKSTNALIYFLTKKGLI